MAVIKASPNYMFGVIQQEVICTLTQPSQEDLRIKGNEQQSSIISLNVTASSVNIS